MSKENESKVEKVEETKDVKGKGDDLRKKVDSIAFTVRKIKDWMEEKMGADIDGDGRVGSGPYKKVLAFLVMVGIASICSAAHTNVALWVGTESSPTAGVHDDGGIFAPYFVGDLNVADADISGNANVTGSITGGTAKVTGSVVVGNGLTVGTNLTVGKNINFSGVLTGSCSGASGVPITVTKQTGVITAGTTITPQAPSAVTPTITVTKETGAVTASGANNLVTPTATLTPATGNFVISLTLQTYQLTNDTALVVTNVVVTTASAWTNATAGITPDLASNAVVLVSVTGGAAVMTNATASSSTLPLFATNATASTSITGGGAVMTNATASNP
jgi:hypothetical protein